MAEETDKLVARIEGLPARPGVYLFKNARGGVIYVGKAKSLRSRLRGYLREGDGRYQVRFLMDKARDVETLVTATETEALILENNLIKQYKPRYNIQLKDDKSYLSVKITSKDDWPRVMVTRNIKRDGNTYLGPYVSASSLRVTIDTIRKVFPLRTCSDAVFRNRSRPCLEYQIKRCMAPCVFDIDRKQYALHLKGAIRLLEGKAEGLIEDLSGQMHAASQADRFEEAAKLRDRIEAVRKVSEGQKVLLHGGGDRDVFGLYREGGFIEVQVLLVRAGRLVGNRGFNFKDNELPDDEVLSSLLGRFYSGRPAVPDEVLLPFVVEGMGALGQYLSDYRDRKVSVVAPLRGEKRRLVEMAMENAEHGFAERNDEAVRREATLAELKIKLSLASVPKRIECFDISHIQGEAVVASMVTFDEGQADKAGYRRYRLRGVQRNDDFAAMKEVLSRRLQRGLKEGGLPDLLVVDGGRGQLAQAVEAIKELEVKGVELCALAKEKVEAAPRQEEIKRVEDRVFRPGRSNPVKLSRNSSALFLLQQIRDEAHRFAISYHRSLRSRTRLRSALDAVEGVGAARAKALLSRFGSTKRVAKASIEELTSVRGITEPLARRILKTLT
ncbi:MAG: excinuclease ABC subunit UvrC [Deltaproteobacteria bacterium]